MIAASVTEMIKKKNTIELENVLKVENERISTQRVPPASSSIQPATQAQVPYVIQNQPERTQRLLPELERRLELIKKKEETDSLIDSSMTKLLADFIGRTYQIQMDEVIGLETAETKQKSDEEHSEQYARLMETLMAAHGTTLTAIHSYIGNKPIWEMLLHIYKLLIQTTEDSQKISEISTFIAVTKTQLMVLHAQKINSSSSSGTIQTAGTDQDAERVNKEGVIFQGNRNDSLAVASCPILFKRVDFQVRQNSSPAVASQYSQRVDFQASQTSSPAVAPFNSMRTDSLATLNSSIVVAPVFNSQRVDLQEIMKFFGTDINTSGKVPFSNQTPPSQQRVITSCSNARSQLKLHQIQ
ncbi:MAG: hypothetical protein EZS28_008126 [Streblomastix strix]|uniref:Uncharacterized protein n=1 Tax=Streblomastix strix TaxID=222440 RepID=A0A5J4WN73_9EUKA|nr:MAG: hypothetical protein EZS28_008126 [Streblomastix strix]